MIQPPATTSWSSLCRIDRTGSFFDIDERLASILDSLASGVMVASAEGVLFYRNHYAATRFKMTPGLDLNRMLSRGGWTLLDHRENPIPLNLSPLATCIATGLPTPMTTLGIQRPNRSPIWVELCCHPLFAPDRQHPSAVVLTFTDITRSKRHISKYAAANNRLLQEAMRSRLLMNNCGDGIVITDQNHRVIEANQRFADMLGYRLEEMTGLSIWNWEAVHSEEEIRRSPPDPATIDHIFETRHRRRDGSVYDAEVRSSGAVIDGKPMAFSIIRDITQRKRSEREIVLARQRAETASKHKSEFLTNMSHEIRTPLNGIMGILQLMQGEEMSPALKAYVKNALSASRRLTRLLGDILDLSQVEAGMLKIHPQIFDLSDTLQSLKNIFQPAFLKKGVKLHLVHNSQLSGYLVGDVTRLQQILTNLVGNSLKFTDSGSVTVEASLLAGCDPGKRRVFFSVTDTGIGIPEDMIDVLFDDFVQVKHDFIRNYQGAGLGLAISRRLIRLLGGNMSISSEEGRGTSFYLSLPFTLADQPPPSTQPTTTTRTSGTLQVLVAEDDRISQMVISKVLGNLGHRVYTAQNGREVLDILTTMPHFDALLIDIQMPVMDGVEVTQTLRSNPAFRACATIPIIAMTAYAMAGDREAFLASGMDDYIAKPIDPDNLMSILGRLTTNR